MQTLNVFFVFLIVLAPKEEDLLEYNVCLVKVPTVLHARGEYCCNYFPQITPRFWICPIS